MSNAVAVQIHCPFCNGVQQAQEAGNYTCEFCLQPFSIVQAQKEESRLLEEIRGWLDKRIGSAGAAAGGVDASSRAYIFQQRILPDLRREVDRSLETLGSYNQFQLVPVPVPTPQAGGFGPNPLVSSRGEILALKNLRARLQSDYIKSFAVGGEDQAAVQSLDRRLAEIMGLSNVADAANRKDPSGYATARRNLESVLGEIGESLAVETSDDPTFKPFLGAQQERYRGLVELCRVCEELTGPNAVSGAALAERASQIGAALRNAAQAIEASGYSPADSMPLVISATAEAASVEYLARWLRAYDTLAQKSLHSFGQFATELTQLFRAGAGRMDAEAATELVESCAWLVRTVRGEAPVAVHADHSWVDGWAEGARTKKSLGLFGSDETVAGVERFLLPVWVAEISFAKSTGAVFKQGVEGRCLALVDATAPAAPKVTFLADGTTSLAQSLDRPRPLSSRAVALPSSTTGAAQQAFKQACSGRQDMLGAQVKLRGLAFMPAACARFESKKGTREAAACAAGQVAVEAGVRASVQSATKVLQQFA